jgi:hypothetical protein
MTFLGILALAFSAFCLALAAHNHIARRGKLDLIDGAWELIFAAGGLATLATALKVLTA